MAAAAAAAEVEGWQATAVGGPGGLRVLEKQGAAAAPVCRS